MGNLFGIFDDEDNREDNRENNHENNRENNREDNKTVNLADGKLYLRKEELDVAKNKVQTGEVILSKEIVEDQKTINVPVTREEVVIERRSLNNECTDSPISAGETIRIPVSEEKIKVGKHTVVTEEISARKREVEETKQIEETLKREEARIDTSGDPNLVNNEKTNSFH